MLLNLTTIREALKDRRLLYISHETGLSYVVLRDLRDKPAYLPSCRTVQRISRYLIAGSNTILGLKNDKEK